MSKISVSLVIPTLEVDEGKKDVLRACIDSFEGMYDELIVIPDKDISLAAKINKGMKKAHGQYIIVSNDDVTIRSGNLRDLCYPGEVDVPVVHGGIDKLFHGHMFCLPREIYKQLGGYDEECPGPYAIDSDYWVRLTEAGIPIVKNCQVHINHPEPGRTLKHLNNQTGDCIEWFRKKWGDEYLRMVS